MALSSRVDAPFKSPSVSVVFSNGAKTRDIVSVEVSRNLSDSISTATVTMLASHGVAPETRIKILQGYDDETQLTFTGVIDSIQHDEFEEVYILSCRDLLKKAMDTFLCQEIKFGIDVDKGKYYYSTYSSQGGGTFVVNEYNSLSALNSAHPETVRNYTEEGVKAEAVVQWLLVMSGLNEGSEIQVDDTNFFIGDINPATFYLTSIFDAISQICDLIGWYVYCDIGGTVRFKQRPRMASAYNVWSYSKGHNIHTISDITTNTDLRNYCEVHGYSGIKHIARQPSPYLGTTTYRGVVIGNEFIDTPEIAAFVANRVLSDLNRLKETVTITADGNPYLLPGQSIRVTSSVANGQFLIESVSTTMSAEGGYKMTLTCSTYPGDISEEPFADITAAFTAIQVASIGDPKILVEFDGSPSYSTRGPISKWEWTFPSDFISDSQPVAWAVFDESAISNGNSQDITLTVYDAFDNVGTITSGITLESLLGNNTLKYRHLYAALDTSGVGSIDGGQVWNTINIPAVSVAASNFNENGSFTTSGYALFGCSDGTVKKTTDVCMSYYDVLSTGSSVRAIEIPELNGSKAVIGNDSGDVYISDDSGETWASPYSFGAPVNQIRFTYKDFTQLLAVVDEKVYDSFDSGVSWSEISLPVASGIHWNAAGSLTNYFAYSSGIVTSSESVSFSGGASPDITAMTIMIDRDDGIMAVDSTGQHWVYDTAMSGMIATQNNPLNTTQYMIRDGEIPIVTYYATQSGVSKSLDRNETIAELYYPDSVYGQMVAYGPLAPIIEPVSGLLLISSNSEDSTGEHKSTLKMGTYPSGWVSLPESGTGRTSVTAGYVVQYNADLSDFGGKFYDFVSAGSGQVPNAVDIQYLGDQAHRLSGIEFRRRRSSPSNGTTMFFVCHHDTGLQFDAYLLKVDYTPPDTFVVTQSDVDSIGNAYAQDSTQTQDSLSSRLVTARFFGHPMNRNTKVTVWNTDDLTFVSEGRSEKSSDSLFYAKLYKAKFDQEWKCLGAHDGSVKRIDGPGERNSTIISIPADDIIDIYDSCLNRSDVYYATVDGVYRVSAYADVGPDTLWTTPPGYRLNAFSVTHDKNHSRDFIAVAYSDFGLSASAEEGYRRGFTVYSVDGGATWIDDLPVEGGYGSDINGIWYVER